MIDGIFLKYYTSNEDTHLLRMPNGIIKVYTRDHSPVDGIVTDKIQGLGLTLAPAVNGGYSFFIRGSIHKFFNNGITNADQFTFSNLKISVNKISDLFQIEPEMFNIHSIEFGVNLHLEVPPEKIIKNIVSYKFKPFSLLNVERHKVGLICKLDDHALKIYDKAKQENIKPSPQSERVNILRVEARISKMRALSEYDINCLSDLTDQSKVYPLIYKLNAMLDNVIWTDRNINLKKLTAREQKQYLFFSNPNNWRFASKHQRHKAKKTWGRFMGKHASLPDIKSMVLEAWKKLFLNNGEADIGRLLHKVSNECTKMQLATFTPLYVGGKGHHFIPKNDNPKKLAKRINVFCNMYPFTGPEKLQKTSSLRRDDLPPKTCLSCGRDISAQRRNSRFCSEAIHGKAGKACRNKRSNINRTCKRVLNHARECGKYIIVTYRVNGSSYSDKLHPDEITLTNDWFYSVQKMKVLN